MHTEGRAAQAEKNKKPHENFDVSLIEHEKRSVLQYLRELKFYVQKEKHLVWIINTYFERVIDLINRAHAFTASPVKTRKVSPYRSAIDALQEILSFLEIQYGRFMDLSICLPIPYEIKLKDALIAAFLQFKENIQACPLLLEVIEFVYADFAAEQENGKTTYYRAFYLLALITSLRKPKPATDATILRTLITFNFNSPAFIECYTLKLRESPETLAFVLKELNQLHVMPGLVLNPLLPSVREQLITWLTQEIAFLANTSTNECPASTPSAQKIMTTLSVSELGHMLRLFSDMGVLVHPNKTELLEAFAAMFRTEKVENISPESLRNNFYNENASIARSVRDLLLAALNKSKGST